MPYFVFIGFSYLPDYAQCAIVRAACNAGAYRLAYDIADHANINVTDQLLRYVAQHWRHKGAM